MGDLRRPGAGAGASRPLNGGTRNRNTAATQTAWLSCGTMWNPPRGSWRGADRLPCCDLWWGARPKRGCTDGKQRVGHH